MLTRRLIFWTITASLVIPPQTWSVETSPDLPQIVRELDALQKEALSAFEPDTIIDNADFDAEEIIAFMREQIAYHPYAGVLRGVRGTLVSRAGNAHDQAITLASLLKSGGYEAQVLYGALSSEQARTLVSEFGNIRSSLPKPPDPPAFFSDEQIQELQASATDLDEIRSEVNAEANAIWQDIRQDKNIATSKDLERALIDETQEYSWVRFRLGESDAWQEVHPSFRKTPPNWQVEWDAVEDGQVSDDALHKLSIQVFMQAGTDDAIGAATPITDPWILPVANAIEQPVRIDFLSDRSGDMTEPLSAIADSYYFFPMFNGSVPDGLKVFDITGKTYPAAALDGLNSVFAQVSRKGTQAITAISGLDDDGSGAAGQDRILRVWIEFKLLTPDVEPRAIQRDVLPLSQNRDNADTRLRLQQNWTIDISAGDRPDSYYVGEFARETVSLLTGVEDYLKFVRENPDASEQRRLSAYAHYLPSSSPTRLRQIRRLFGMFEADGAVESFAHLPQILVLRQGVVLRDNSLVGYELVDIVANSRRSMSVVSPLEFNQQHSLARGVWETRMEREGKMNQFSIPVLNAYDALANSRIDKIVPGDDGLRAVPGQADSGWWQIDRETGSAIGMHSTEFGTAGVEVTEALTVLTVGVSLLFAAVGNYACQKNSNNNPDCCLAAAAGGFFIGLVLSWASALAGTAAAAAAGAGVAAAAAGGAATGFTVGRAFDIYGLVWVDCT